jgi:hypothetical protein
VNEPNRPRRGLGACIISRCWAARAAAALLAALPLGTSHAHGNEARLVEFLDWKPSEHVARIFGANRAHLEGLPSTTVRPQIRTLEGESCLVGELIAFDVDDGYAFDIDEPVELKLTFAAEYTAPFLVGWDQSGGTGAGLTPELTVKRDADSPFGSVTVTLERARLAGQGTQGADVAIAGRGGMALCDIELARSGKTVAPTVFGELELTVKDAATGMLVPARVGLYDSTGRAPLASGEALMLQRFADDLRMLAVNDRTFWPSSNRQAFYVDGKYGARIPAGSYELVITRGPEYRAHRSFFEVQTDRTANVTVELERYADMPAAGWYSGDAHIHVTRDAVEDPNIWGFVAAENVHVGNLLEMGNIQNVYFKQPAAWGRESRFERDGHFIVSGQEAPRTRQFGHTIHFNVRSPVHLSTEEYFLYHKVFEEIAAQGGISGFAHMGWNSAGDGAASVGQMNRGMVLLAPFGLVDFIEVLQGGRLTSDGWYRLLNLGFRVTPAAGTDWPYSDFPGVVRNYVQLDGPLNLDDWFDAFEAGRTFVTNGPLLGLTVNGVGMGRELRVSRGARLGVAANARLNPDVDALERLELVILGDVTDSAAAHGTDRVELRKEIVADRSMWIAARAYGARQDPRNTTIAHSAPVYVVVDDEPTWKRDAVPEIVAELRERLQRILTDPHDTPISGNEPWETRLTLVDQWLLQQPLLRPRVDAADALYQKLLDQWTMFTSGSTPAAAGGAR